MKRLFLMTATFLACTVITLHAAVTEGTDNKYQLTAGNLTMTVDAEKGGKILSLKYQDAEVISQLKWPEAFGSTFWTSPQKEWNWPPVPEFDKMAYTVEAHNDTTLIMKSQVSARLKYSIGKTIRAKSNGSFAITYSIYNESGESRQVAPWEITRVPNEGIIFFDAPLEGITPKGLMDFKAAHGAVWYQADEAKENRKINADGKGWLAYYSNGLLLVKKFQDLQEGQPAPGEAEVQVYVNRGKTYIELESQGAYTTLAPGNHLDWTVSWYLMPAEGEAVPSVSLVEKVKKAIQ